MPQETRKKTTNPKVSRRMKLIKIRAEINQIAQKQKKKINETNSWLFEKIKKINKPLATLQKKRENSSK